MHRLESLQFLFRSLQHHVLGENRATVSLRHLLDHTDYPGSDLAIGHVDLLHQSRLLHFFGIWIVLSNDDIVVKTSVHGYCFVVFDPLGLWQNLNCDNVGI